MGVFCRAVKPKKRSKIIPKLFVEHSYITHLYNLFYKNTKESFHLFHTVIRFVILALLEAELFKFHAIWFRLELSSLYSERKKYL